MVCGLIKDKSIFFLRYIVYIFMLSIKSEKQLKEFMNELNQNIYLKGLTINLTASK